MALILLSVVGFATVQMKKNILYYVSKALTVLDRREDGWCALCDSLEK